MAEWQGFYSTAQVSRLAGIPVRTLYQWKSRGFIRPSVQVTENNRIIDEGYDYADLAIIKLMKALRNKQLNLRSVFIALHHLNERLGPPSSETWANAHVFVKGKDVFAQRPDEWDTTEATRRGQKAEMRVLGELSEEEGAILIPKDFQEYVEINPNIMEGQPVIRNTRLLTSTVAMMASQGIPVSEITELYKPVKQEAIRKAIDFEDRLDRALQKKAA